MADGVQGCGVLLYPTPVNSIEDNRLARGLCALGLSLFSPNTADPGRIPEVLFAALREIHDELGASLGSRIDGWSGILVSKGGELGARWRAEDGMS